MDISTLGRVCYEQFAAARILGVLEREDSFDALRTRQLTKVESDTASSRALARIDRYYCHLQELLSEVAHIDRQAAIARVNVLQSRDRHWLAAIYEALTQKSHSPVDTSPGLALFLQIGARSFALLPGAHEDDCGAVYMAPGWRDVIFNGVLKSEDAKWELRSGIRRSNRLWQRERWSVLPISDTAEPHGGTGAAYFNNIGLHLRPIDGWVDAFWGVQSALRVALPIPGANDSHLVLLLSTYVPDVFSEWNSSPTEYRMPLPADVSEAATSALRTEFSRELAGLSMAVALLADLARNEGALLESSMQLLSHYTYDSPQSPPWEGRVVNLVHQLSQVEPSLSSRVQGLMKLRELSFRHLERVAERLPLSEESATWKQNLAWHLKKGDRSAFTLLTPKCTVGQLVDALKALEDGTGSTISVADSASTELGRVISIDPLLLSAVVKNVVHKHGVSVTVGIRGCVGGVGQWLSLAAFYHSWRLATGLEEDFLLKPLERGPGERKSVGFYLTAQVLWRNGGTIEYYRLGETQGGSTQALIHLGFPLR